MASDRCICLPARLLNEQVPNAHLGAPKIICQHLAMRFHIHNNWKIVACLRGCCWASGLIWPHVDKRVVDTVWLCGSIFNHQAFYDPRRTLKWLYSRMQNMPANRPSPSIHHRGSSCAPPAGKWRRRFTIPHHRLPTSLAGQKKKKHLLLLMMSKLSSPKCYGLRILFEFNVSLCDTF